MSWSSQCCESNEFKVKNLEEVKEVLEGMGFGTNVKKGEGTICFFSQDEESGAWFEESTEVVLSLKPREDGTNFVGVMNMQIDMDLELLLAESGLEEKDIIVQPITEYFQDQLVEGYGIVVTTSGFTGRCSGNSEPFGEILVISKNSTRFSSLYNLEKIYAKELGVQV